MTNTPLNLSASTTHDLWVEARKFKIDISRPNPDQIKLVVTRPKNLQIVDGYVVLLSTEPISSSSYPKDGEQYLASTDWTNPADVLGSGTHVVGAYYGMSNRPMPVSDTGEEGVDINSTEYTVSITITNTTPSKIYYASVHAVTNVVQYYPIGVQSYPLEGALLERAIGAYSGNIPSLPTAPTNPTHGLVYHDQQLNITQFWDGSRQAWIPTRSDTVASGEYNPGTLGQVYLLTGNTVMVFNGIEWIQGTGENLQVKLRDSTWVPFKKLIAATVAPVDVEAGTFFYNFTLQRCLFWDGVSWEVPNASNTLLTKPDKSLSPAFIAPPTVEPIPLASPALGQLFYNTTAKALNVWDGVRWIKANTDQEGTPLSDKFSIGNDGSYNERVRLIKILAGQMGWPVQCVELKETQFNIAIDNAIETFRQLSDTAYRREFILYKLLPNQQLYYMNSAIDKTDSIVDIHAIHRMGPMGVFGGSANDTWSQAFAQQFYNMSVGNSDMVSTTLIAQYGEDLTRMFAGNLMYQWNEASRELHITRAIRGEETVVIECMLERTEQEIMADRWSKQFIQDWALAEVKMMLGMIRSKFSSGTPGASGSITLNGELLIAEARQDFTELKEALLNYEYGAMVGKGNVSFLIG